MEPLLILIAMFTGIIAIRVVTGIVLRRMFPKIDKPEPRKLMRLNGTERIRE